MSNRRLHVVPEDHEDFHDSLVTIEAAIRRHASSNMLRDILLGILVVCVCLHTYLILRVVGDDY